MKKHLVVLAILATTIFGVTLYAAAVPVAHITRDYSATNVATNAYVAIATVAATVSEVEIFDSSGNIMILATGTAGGESDQLFITPGGNGFVPLSVPAGTRFSVKAKTALTTAGNITVNFYK